MAYLIAALILYFTWPFILVAGIVVGCFVIYLLRFFTRRNR